MVVVVDDPKAVSPEACRLEMAVTSITFHKGPHTRRSQGLRLQVAICHWQEEAPPTKKRYQHQDSTWRLSEPAPVQAQAVLHVDANDLESADLEGSR